MIAFEVYRNGEKICTAGAEDLAVLSADVTACGKLGSETMPPRPEMEPDEQPDLFCRVGGLTGRHEPQQDEHLRWVYMDLQIGDTITFKVLDTTDADPPAETKPAKRSS